MQFKEANQSNRAHEGTIDDKNQTILKLRGEIKKQETQILIAEKKATDSNNDFDELSNAL